MILAIYCAGGLGKEIIAFARYLARWPMIVFVDDVIDEKWFQDARVYRFGELQYLPDKVEFVIASGEPAGRAALYKKIKDAGYPMATIISPGCLLPPSSTIGEGSIIYDCAIAPDVKVGVNVLINTKATIGHDVVIGDNCIISAFSFVGGHSTIGKNTYLGAGAMIKDRLTVGDNAIISLGAVALRNVRSEAIMVGNPAKEISQNTEKKVFELFD